MWRNIASNLFTLLIVALVVVAGMLAWAQREYTGPGPLAEPICFRVERGDSFRKVSEALAGQGAVSSAFILRVGADYADKIDDLKFGSYLIRPEASMAEIVDILSSGQSTCGTEVNFRIGVTALDVILRELDPATDRYVEVVRFDPVEEAAPPDYVAVAERPDVRFRVTVAEGTTVWQVVEGLKRAEFLTGVIEDLPAEGTLAPDSYELRRGDDRNEVIADMQDRQDRVLARAWAERVDGLPYETPEEALVMASLIEKETGVAEERGLIAGVFVNRLRAGMRLQTDPAVIYGVTRGQGVLGRGLRQSELRRETPWNTYVIEGLPPTPIANPGRASIVAALDPEATDYLFFVADGTGGHAFAETLQQHNANVAQWRRIEAEQGGN